MAASSKMQLIAQIYEILRKKFKVDIKETRLTILEAVVYAICRDGTTREQANQVMSRFKDSFFDWNEVRVSALVEIEDTLAGLPARKSRAEKVRRFLRQLFRRTYGFSLDPLLKKPFKDATKVLQEYDAFRSDYVLATVIQQALGGHAIPVDEAMLRALRRLGIAAENVEPIAIRPTLEHAIAKNRGAHFVDLFEELTQKLCLAQEPLCPECELRKCCAFGQKRAEALKAAKTKPSGASPSSASAKAAPKKPEQPAAKKSTPKAPAPKTPETPKATKKPSLKAAAPKTESAKPKPKPKPKSKPTPANKGAAKPANKTAKKQPPKR